MDYVDENGELKPLPDSRLDADGNEVLDQTPVALPVRFKRPQSLLDQMRAVVHEMSLRAQEFDVETWEEANDFEVGDDFEFTSQYEVDDVHDENFYADRRDYYRERNRKKRDPEPPASDRGGTEKEAGAIQSDKPGDASAGSGGKTP